MLSTAAAMTSLPAILTLRDAPAVLASLRSAFAAETGDTWLIDATHVEQLDTSALAILLECARIAAAGGRRLEITGVPPRMAELARLYGLDGLLPLTEPAAGAVPPVTR
ncbi:MAG TPA: STAS domain-containing protein [Burkholderiaceae bacterium]|jgi:phospholipid transport system transporter-binding protein|nr:STAS domain-containing protein [Burkholderiaceae bacterium]